MSSSVFLQVVVGVSGLSSEMPVSLRLQLVEIDCDEVDSEVNECRHSALMLWFMHGITMAMALNRYQPGQMAGFLLAVPGSARGSLI